jgi:hypothetical protein
MKVTFVQKMTNIKIYKIYIYYSRYLMTKNKTCIQKMKLFFY